MDAQLRCVNSLLMDRLYHQLLYDRQHMIVNGKILVYNINNLF